MGLGIIKAFALTGGDWVIWGLLLASVFALAIIIERALVLRREDLLLAGLRGKLLELIDADKLEAADKLLQSSPGAVSRILRSGLLSIGRGPASAEHRFVAASLEERRFLEKRLLVLGTLGNNAPFVGLFGTVLGVIRAFHDLARHSSAGPEVVMAGLSEALIATAVGLFVAIPCVISYNYFKKQVQDLLTATETLSRLILSHLRSA
ncbi:MAG: MotA/TolQ/ExbB proton channel family protein [Elusimicrobiota bacterium]